MKSLLITISLYASLSASTALSCEYDSQCRGGKVCEDGRCVTAERFSFRQAATVDVDCQGTTPASVTYTCPPGFHIENPVTQWENTSNLSKSLAPGSAVDGSKITVSGNIQGLDKDLFGGCKGGGHGSLVVAGDCVPD